MLIVLSGGRAARREAGDGLGVEDEDALELEAPPPVVARMLDDEGRLRGSEEVAWGAAFAAFVAEREQAQERPRWVWSTAEDWYPALLAAGVRVERCWDLRACAGILALTLLLPEALRRGEPGADEVEELRRQRALLAAAEERGRLELLLAAESSSALVAAELRFVGLPWSPVEHDRILTALLGPRPPEGVRPAVLAALHREIEAALDGRPINPDSPQDTLRALRLAGLPVSSTRSWELRGVEHPAIRPLLEYRGLARLLTANGWSWLERWVRDGRFHPEYVPGGVITGRWASSGGGALQLPRQIRGAVRAEPGRRLVVADCAQLEPRILAAMAGDRAMTAAGAGGDLYAGLVAAGVVDTRPHAKVAMLGALYGATSGEGGRLMPRLARAFPKAVGLVEQAARDGEAGLPVRTRLGRSSPPESVADWSPQHRRAHGRFTRNFVVQGTAAEWAAVWLGGIRGRLAAGFPGVWPAEVPELVFFLHDEVVVHAPAGDAAAVEGILREAADDAGRLLFGAPPDTFPLTVAVVDSYADAK